MKSLIRIPPWSIFLALLILAGIVFIWKFADSSVLADISERESNKLLNVEVVEKPRYNLNTRLWEVKFVPLGVSRINRNYWRTAYASPALELLSKKSGDLKPGDEIEVESQVHPGGTRTDFTYLVRNLDFQKR